MPGVPGGWLTRLAALLLAVTLAGACSREVPLQVNLTDADANEIALVLSRSGIEVEKRRDKETVTLLVAATDLARASAAMHAAGLPRRAQATLGEVFKKQGMISSPLEERIRYIHGLSEELGYTLQKFDHVISARVHVVLPERVAPGEPILPSSAAVFVKYQPPMDEDAAVPRIRNLVASSIPGLSGEEGRNKVSVVMLPAEILPPQIEWSRVGPFMIAAESAGYLRFTLLLLLLCLLAGAGLAAAAASRRSPRFAALLDKARARVTSVMQVVRKAGK